MDKLEDFADQANRLLCGVIFAVQSAFLDYYLIFNLGTLWFLWIIADLAVVGVMLYAFIVTYLYKRGHITRFIPHPYPGDLPFAYSVWLVYSITLAVRIGVLFKTVTPNLKTTDLFGPNRLQMSIALAVPFLYFVIKAVSLRKGGHMKQSTEMRLFCEEVLNIIDGIELLTILFSKTDTAKLSVGLPDAILAFGCITLLVPTINLAVYSVSKYDDYFGTSRIVRAIYVLAALFLINLPLLVLRVVIWHSSNVLSCLFITKNAIFIVVHFLDIISIIIDQQPNQYQVNTKPSRMPLQDNNNSRQSPPVANDQQKPSIGTPRNAIPAKSDTANSLRPNNEPNRRRPLPSSNKANPEEEGADV